MITLSKRSENTIGWVAVLLLLGGCLFVMLPFVSILIWGVVLAAASWPIRQRLMRWFHNRSGLVAFTITFSMVLVLLMPLILIGPKLANNVDQLTTAARKFIAEGPPAPPAWLAKLPIVGQRATNYWQSLSQDSTKLWAESRKLIEPISSILLKVAVGIGGGLLQLAASLFIAFFLLRDGGAVADRLNATVNQIGGDRGGYLLLVAYNTIRGVVYGILGTALLQGVLAGIGYFIAGVPGAGLLALLTFFFSIVPVLGTGIVWLPVALWLFHQGATGWGIFMLIWGFGVGSLDNFVKPWLISQGSDMPFLLIFFGVLGGALAFGFMGVFLGPTLLAVGYRLLNEWAPRAPTSTATSAPPLTGGESMPATVTTSNMQQAHN